MFKKIKKQYSHKFNVTQDGLYSITVKASCKSGKMLGLFGGEELRVEIDKVNGEAREGSLGYNQKLREIPAEKKAQYFNIPPAWNGTKLKGLSKTVIFIIKLNKGTHKLKFIPKKGATIQKEPVINLVKNNKLTLNKQAQDGDKRPWITLALIDLKLKTLDVSVKCEQRKRDSDDVKIIIDNKVQENKQSSWWGKKWYFRGSKLQGKTEETRFYPKLSKGIHYVEFWADRTPVLNEIKMDLGIKGEKKILGKIALHKDIIIYNEVNLRSESKKRDENGKKLNNIITQIKNNEKVEILKEKEVGEYITNKSNIWHKIKWQDKVGYVLSSFIEIKGQEREIIIEKIKNEAKKQGINEDFALALSGCESQYKPYAVSGLGARGIFQLTGIARDHLAKEFDYPISDDECFNVDKNIVAGLKYLNWVMDKYKDVKTDRDKKIVAAWNAGRSLIPAQGSISYDKIKTVEKKTEVKNLIRFVEINKKKKNWKYISTLVFLLFTLFSGILYFSRGEYAYSSSAINTAVIDEPKFKLYDPFWEGGHKSDIKSITLSNISEEPGAWETVMDIEGDGWTSEKKFSGYLENAYLFNLNFHDHDLFLVRREGKQILTTILRYDKNTKSLRPLKFIDKDGIETTEMCCSFIIFKPMTNGVQYNLAIQTSNYDKNSGLYIGSYERVYMYDFQDRNFYEGTTSYIPYIPGG